MNLIRLLKIISTSLRFGLDEILVRSLNPTWYTRFWFTLFAWRRYKEERGVRIKHALETLGPIFVKFGQMISTRKDILPKDIAEELAKLQDNVTAQSFAIIKETLSQAYDQPLDKIFQSIEEKPIGSASVAQVHKATLINDTVVAVKILRPHIQEQITKDIALLDGFAYILEKILKDGKRMRPREVVAEFHTSLKQETDLLHEAANCNQIKRNFVDNPMICVPTVHWDECNSKVMVMELLEGIPIDQVEELKAKNIDLEKLAKTGIEVFFTQVFRDSFFHADMHPGNIHVDEQGRFVVLDFGIMGSLEDHDTEYIGANFLAFFNRDYRRVAVMHVEAGWTPSDISITQFEAAIRAVCEPIFSKPLQEISFGRLLLQLINVARKFNLIVQPQLLLLQKTLLSIEGIGRQLAPDLNLWDSAKPFLENWSKEQNSPKRIAKIIRENTPSMISLLPEIPVALKAKVRHMREQERKINLEIANLHKKNKRLTFIIVIFVILLITTWLV